MDRKKSLELSLSVIANKSKFDVNRTITSLLSSSTATVSLIKVGNGTNLKILSSLEAANGMKMNTVLPTDLAHHIG